MPPAVIPSVGALARKPQLRWSFPWKTIFPTIKPTITTISRAAAAVKSEKSFSEYSAVFFLASTAI
jgi:hypothetical protein